MKDHPEEVVVLKTDVKDTVLANQNDPDKVAIVLEHAQELLSGDKSSKEGTEMTFNEPFLRQASAVGTPDDNKQMTRGVTIGSLLLQWQKEGRLKGNTLDLDKTCFIITPISIS